MVDLALSRARSALIRREDAERFVDEVRGDDPELASYLRRSKSVSSRRAGGTETPLS